MFLNVERVHCENKNHFHSWPTTLSLPSSWAKMRICAPLSGTSPRVAAKPKKNRSIPEFLYPGAMEILEWVGSCLVQCGLFSSHPHLFLIDAIITLLPSCDNQKWVQSCQMSLEGSGGAEVASVENHIWPLRTRRIGQSQYKLPILMAAGTVSLIQCLSRILEGYITSQAGKLLTWVSSEYVFKIRLLFILPRKSFAFS